MILITMIIVKNSDKNTNKNDLLILKNNNTI